MLLFLLCASSPPFFRLLVFISFPFVPFSFLFVYFCPTFSLFTAFFFVLIARFRRRTLYTLYYYFYYYFYYVASLISDSVLLTSVPFCACLFFSPFLFSYILHSPLPILRSAFCVLYFAIPTFCLI